MNSFAAAWSPRVLSILRFVAGLLFFFHGTQKILGFPAPPGFEIGQLGYIAGLIEIVGSPFIMLGLFTRPVAFILSGLMAFAYFLAHHPQSIYPVLNRGDSAILFCFVFFYLVFAGGGVWSLDHLLFGGSREEGEDVARARMQA